MANQESLDGYATGIADCVLSLAACSCCRSVLDDPVMLSCLHTYCRSCLESSDCATQNEKAGINCRMCSESCELSAVIGNSLLYNHMRLSVLYSEAVYCSACDAEAGKADFWCADCCTALCATCYSWHNRFNWRHRSAELKIARTWSFSQLTPTAMCSIHKRRIEVYCYTCCQPKCLMCYDSCTSEKHKLQPLSHDATGRHASCSADAIRGSTERLSRLLSDLKQKNQFISTSIRGFCEGSDTALLKRKRLLQDAALNAFERSFTKMAAYPREYTEVVVTPQSVRDASTYATRHTELLSFSGVFRLHFIRVRRLLEATLRFGTVCCKVSLKHLLLQRNRIGSIVFNTSMPLTADAVLSACLGTIHHRRAAPAAPLIFGQVGRSFRTPIDCVGVAVTRDGHVLLPAAENGLFEFNDRGQQLSSWRPVRRSNERDDQVMCLAVLQDGRVAVGLLSSYLVVLLRRSETGDGWLEDRRVGVLHSPPLRLAAHGDLLAVTETRLDERLQDWAPGRHLQLLRVSRAQRLYRQYRDYDIQMVALTALCIITSSADLVNDSTGLRPYHLDAFSHAGHFLWRHEFSTDEEFVPGLCAAATWSRVYVIVWSNDYSDERVVAINGADGRYEADVMSCRTHGLLHPSYISVARGQQRTYLALLSANTEGTQMRTVTVYEATSE